MKKLTDMEVATVFRQYPLCPVLISDNDVQPVTDKLQGVIFESPMAICEGTRFPVCEVKLVLKPVHHMSDLEIVKAARTYDNTGFLFATGSNVTVLPTDIPGVKRIAIDNCPYAYRIDLSTGSIAMFKEGKTVWSQDTAMHLPQWYYNNNIAIPHYFEPAHWANGRTPIELGVAVPDRKILRELLNLKFNNDKTEIGNWWLENEKVNFYDITVMDEWIAKLKKEINDRKEL